MINPIWLNTFCSLVELQHFTRTAEKLHMTQSGVSQQIKKLETQLGRQLLVRVGKSFTVTNSGRQLFQKGQQLLQSAEELEALIKQDDSFIGNVKVASPGSIGLKLYPHLLHLQQQHPSLSIDYSFAPNTRIEQDLLAQNIDLGLVTQLPLHSQLRSEIVAIEPLVLVTSNKVKVINWSVLLDLGFISHPDAAHHGNQLLAENFAEFEHIEQFPHKGFSNQIGLILEPVSLGFGFTVLPLYAALAYGAQHLIKVHSLDRPVSENLYLCQNRQSAQYNRIKQVKSVVMEYLNQENSRPS